MSRAHRGDDTTRAVVVAAAVVALCVGGAPIAVDAVEPIGSAGELEGLCQLGAPELEGGDAEESRDYQRRRRNAVHTVYETPLTGIEQGAMDYDRVGGVLTISGFGAYRPFSGAPSIRFRNESVIGFQFDEQTAHDRISQIQMGTVEVRVGIAPIARRDYDSEFCVTSRDEAQRQLIVDLMYVRLVDTEQSESEGGRVIETFYTRRGHRWALRNQAVLSQGESEGIPAVDVSHLQWRAEGHSWQEGFDGDRPEQLDELDPELTVAIEQALYPCYVQVLGTNAALQGAVVMEIPLGEQTPGSPSFLMDTIQTPPMRECVDQRLSGLDELQRASDVEGVDALKATVLMRRRTDR